MPCILTPRRAFRRAAVKLLVVFVVFIGLALASAAPPISAQQVQARYDAIARALQRNDFRRLVSNYARGFVYVDKTGKKYGVAQVRALYKKLGSTLPIRSVRTTIRGIVASKTGASVQAQSRVEAIIVEPRTKRKREVVVITESRDTWVRQAGRWRLRKMINTSDRTFVDGKRMGG